MTVLGRRLSAALLVAAALTARAGDWTVDAGQSRLGFTARCEDIPVDGMFQRWRAPVQRFDPADPGAGQFDVRIDTASTLTGTSEVNEALLLPDWFDAAAYPEARFLSSDIRTAGGEGFVATGTLELKGVLRPVTVRFTWMPVDDGVRMRGDARLNRSHFRVGTVEWSDAGLIALEVMVRLDLRLRPAPLQSR